MAMLVCCGTHAAMAQSSAAADAGLRTVMDGSALRMTMYHVGANPAWLYETRTEPPLKFHAGVSTNAGDYHSPFEPGYDHLYDYYAEGARQLHGSHFVKGRFGFTQEFRGDWQWMDTKSYASGNPFLIADSSRGVTAYRGIAASGEYSVRVTDDVLAGASLRYGVNNGLKQVTPKPTSLNRDIDVSVGTAYKLSPAAAAGAVLSYHDRQEEITFAVDETAIQSQTILYKFRGYDAFIRSTKNTEQRSVQARGYDGRLNASFGEAGGVQAVGYAGAGMQHLMVTDGGTSPVKQGHWQEEAFDGFVKMTVPVSGLRAGAIAGASSKRQWARHPEYDVAIAKNTLTAVNAGAGIEYEFGTASAGAEYRARYDDNEYADYLSRLRAQMRRMTHTVSAGLRTILAEETVLAASYSYEIGDPVRTGVTISEPSPMYTLVRRLEFEYLRASSRGHSVCVHARFPAGMFGTVDCAARYTVVHADSPDGFASAARSTADLSIAFEL